MQGRPFPNTLDSSLHRAAVDAAITSAYGSLTVREPYKPQTR